MNVPPELQKHIDDALRQVENLPASEPDIESRLAIYNFFSTLPDLKGRTARTYLAITVAQKVLPLVKQPNGGYSTMPHLMNATAAGLLERMREGMSAQQLDELAEQTTVEALLGQETLSTIFNPADHPIHQDSIEDLLRLAEEMDSLTGTPDSSLHYHAYCVHLAAMNALEEALGWNWWTQTDGSKWAVIAYSGGSWTAFEALERREDEFGAHGNGIILRPMYRLSGVNSGNGGVGKLYPPRGKRFRMIWNKPILLCMCIFFRRCSYSK
jgi:hypothetical protein